MTEKQFKIESCLVRDFLLCPVCFGNRKVETIALAGIIMVNGIIFSKIKIKIDDFMKASTNKNTAVKVASVI